MIESLNDVLQFTVILLITAGSLAGAIFSFVPKKDRKKKLSRFFYENDRGEDDTYLE